MLILRNVKIQAQQNYLPDALHHKSFTSRENKEAKKLSKSRATLRNSGKNLNVVKIILHGTFDNKKVKHVLMLELCLKEHGAF